MVTTGRRRAPIRRQRGAWDGLLGALDAPLDRELRTGSATPFGHRSDHGDDGRRPADDEHRRHNALGLEEENEDARQDRELTLRSAVRTARPEGEGDGGDSWKTTAAEPEKVVRFARKGAP